MQLTKDGVIFEDYKSAAPGREWSTFTDIDGTTLVIKTETLVHMYELARFVLTHQGHWDDETGRVK